MSRAGGRSGRAPWPWPPVGTTSPPCAPPAPPTCSSRWPTRPRCSTRSSLERLRSLERACGRARGLPPPPRARGAGGGSGRGPRDPPAPGLPRVAAHRPAGGDLAAGQDRAADRTLPADGHAGGGRGRAGSDRARHRGDRPRARAFPPGVAAPFRARLRDPHGPPRAARRAGAMSAPLKIPIPLRVPELAPSLGRLLVPRRLVQPWVPLDDIREELATRVIELGGEARAAGLQEDRERVLEAVSRRAWLAAWERAVRRVAERLTQALDGRIERAARRVRLPRRRRVSAAERRAIAARLASGGEHFVAALDALDAAAARARQASVLDKAAHAEWQEAVRTAARRLEEAWLALEAEAAEEERRWAAEIEAVERWRPSLWPVFALWAPLAAALVWLGLVVGGYLPAPAWLAQRLGF